MIFEIEENVTFEVLDSKMSCDGNYHIYFSVRETGERWRLVCSDNGMKWERLMPDYSYTTKGMPTIYGVNYPPLKEFFDYAKNMKKLAEYEVITKTIKNLIG
jgi:hypothetical protein